MFNHAGTSLTFARVAQMRGNRQDFEWHQDNQYGYLSPMNAVTTILALDDTTLENGALWVVKGSHLHGQRPADWSPLKEG